MKLSRPRLAIVSYMLKKIFCRFKIEHYNQIETSCEKCSPVSNAPLPPCGTYHCASDLSPKSFNSFHTGCCRADAAVTQPPFCEPSTELMQRVTMSHYRTSCSLFWCRFLTESTNEPVEFMPLSSAFEDCAITHPLKYQGILHVSNSSLVPSAGSVVVKFSH